MKLLNITYRLPISLVQNSAEDILVKISSGGLVSALSSLPENKYSLEWLGVADFTMKEWKNGGDKYQGAFKLHPVFLTDKLNKNFYEGFSNSVLWPLVHYFPSFVDYTEDYLDAYKTANKQIAEKANSILSDNDLVWIHDYHLLPLAAELRALRPNLTIGFFLHTPFPSYEIMRVLPKECIHYLLEGMLGADLIGFHTYDYLSHFLDTVKHTFGLQHEKLTLPYNGRSIKLDAYPISIDFEKFHHTFDDEAVCTEREALQQKYPGMKIIFSVDRLDYSKGITHRLKGYRKFLELHPEWHEKIVFILVMVPSRTGISKYHERRRMIEEMVGSINGKLGSYKWAPVVFQFSSLNYNELLGLYTGCDVALISPLRDGMNLVAKEFVASRKNKKGVLLLSNLAGAANELSYALHFNPLDEYEIAANINTALTMPEEEQARRLEAMQSQIKKYDVNFWAENFIGDLENCAVHESGPVFLNYEEKNTLALKYAAAQKRLIVLDYDGTLAPFQREPKLASPSAEVMELLNYLGNNKRNRVVVASGRERNSLDTWLGKLPITIIAEHGAYIKRNQWHDNLSITLDWKQKVKEIMEMYVSRCMGAFVEEKEFSVAWHYRNCEAQMGINKAHDLIHTLQLYLENSNTTILDGNKVIEVKPAAITKGNALRQFFNLNEYESCIVIGDDKTDEDMFKAANDYRHAYTIKVGPGNTAAKYRLETSGQVISLLQQLKAVNGETALKAV